MDNKGTDVVAREMKYICKRRTSQISSARSKIDEALLSRCDQDKNIDHIQADKTSEEVHGVRLRFKYRQI